MTLDHSQDGASSPPDGLRARVACRRSRMAPSSDGLGLRRPSRLRRPAETSSLPALDDVGLEPFLHSADLMRIERRHHYACDCDRQADVLRARIEDPDRSRRRPS